MKKNAVNGKNIQLSEEEMIEKWKTNKRIKEFIGELNKEDPNRILVFETNTKRIEMPVKMWIEFLEENNNG